jgi:hypothetical protein
MNIEPPKDVILLMEIKDYITVLTVVIILMLDREREEDSGTAQFVPLREYPWRQKQREADVLLPPSHE